MKKNNYQQLMLDFIFSGFLILTSIHILKFVLPKGLTTDFLLRGNKLIIVTVSSLIVIFLLSWIFNKNFKFKKKFEIPEVKDFILIALPMSPVIDYVLLNTEYLNIFGFFIYLVLHFYSVFFLVTFYQ